MATVNGVFLSFCSGYFSQKIDLGKTILGPPCLEGGEILETHVQSRRISADMGARTPIGTSRIVHPKHIILSFLVRNPCINMLKKMYLFMFVNYGNSRNKIINLS